MAAVEKADIDNFLLNYERTPAMRAETYGLYLATSMPALEIDEENLIFNYAFPLNPEAIDIHAGRRELSAKLGELGIDTVGPAGLAHSEGISNAWRHATPLGMRAAIFDSPDKSARVYYGEVRDDGKRPDPTSGGDRGYDEGGLGLDIVIDITDFHGRKQIPEGMLHWFAVTLS